MTETIPPVQLSVHVPLGSEEAFRHWTAGMSTWWPLSDYSVSRSRAKTCGIDARTGGNVWEESIEGERIVWGTIVVWDPPRRLVFTWHPGSDAATAQEVEIRFRPDGDGTRVELEHRGWEVLGEEAAAKREVYANGWRYVVESRYVESAGAERRAR